MKIPWKRPVEDYRTFPDDTVDDGKFAQPIHDVRALIKGITAQVSGTTGRERKIVVTKIRYYMQHSNPASAREVLLAAGFTDEEAHL